MRVLIWGSRNLTWRHLPVMRAVASDALLERSSDPEWPHIPMPSVGLFARLAADGGDEEWPRYCGPITLLNGDGPPGSKVRGAVGADKLAVFACMECWPERRRVRWFPPEPKDGETWAQAAARRDVEMAEARPERAYVVHENLDASKGSIITADAMNRLGLPFWYVRVSPAGEVFKVELR